MIKSEDEAWDLFETLSENSMHHASSSSQGSRQTPTILKKSLCEVSQSAGISLPAKEWEEMKEAIQQLRSRASLSPPPSGTVEACAICASPLHDVHSCPSGAQFVEVANESANAAQGYPNQGGQPFGNTYNPGWRKAPGFNWKDPNGAIQPPRPSYAQQGPPFQPPTGQGQTSFQPTFSPPQQFSNIPPQRQPSYDDRNMKKLEDYHT